MANMAGAWVCMASGFGGMTVTAQGIAFDPRLPAQLRGYGFRAAYQGRVIEVRVDAQGPHYALISGQPLTIRDRGQEITLQ